MFTFSKIADTVADFASSIQATISKEVLVPLSTTATLILVIWGHTHGWKRLDTYWGKTGNLEKGALAAGIALLFLLLAAVMREFEPLVSRAFLGDWGNTSLARLIHRKKANRHAITRGKLRDDMNIYEEFNLGVETTRSKLKRLMDRSEVCTARRTFNQFEVIAPGSIASKAQNGTSQIDARFDFHLALRRIAGGETVTAADVLAPPNGSSFTNYFFCPILVRTQRMAIDPEPGVAVSIAAMTDAGFTLINPNTKWVVVAAGEKSESADGQGSIQKITLAVPKSRLSDIDRWMASEIAIVSMGHVSTSPMPGVEEPPSSPSYPREIARQVEKLESNWLSLIAQETEKGSDEARALIKKLTLEIYRDFEYVAGWYTSQVSNEVQVREVPIHLAVRSRGLQSSLIARLRDAWQRGFALERREIESRTEMNRANLDAIVDSIEDGRGFGRSVQDIPSIRALGGNFSWPSDRLAFDTFSRSYSTMLHQILESTDYLFRDAQLELRTNYSIRAGEVVATSAGNIMLAANHNVEDAFGARIDLLLPAMKSSISDDCKQTLKDAEARLSLLHWSWVGLLVIALVGTPIAVTGDHRGIALLVWLGSIVSMWCVGGGAIRSATRNLADAIKLAYIHDRYRVLAFYGHNLPSDTITASEEARIWRSINQLIVLGIPPNESNLKRDSDKKSVDSSNEA